MEITLHPSHDQNLVLKPMIQAMVLRYSMKPQYFYCGCNCSEVPGQNPSALVLASLCQAHLILAVAQPTHKDKYPIH